MTFDDYLLKEDFIFLRSEEAINGTLSILKSIVAHAPRVKRVVLTSSFAAVIDFSKSMAPGHVYDESQWNPISYKKAANNMPGPGYA